jgi:arylsulfatase A-like enzyme
MQRRIFLANLLGGALATQAAPSRPNVVLILFDDLGWKDFSCYGNDFHRTPNIDAIAREGVRFTNAYATCPVCSPTRSSVLTGKYPARTGVTDWIPGRAQWPSARLITPRTPNQMKLEETTIAERLKQAGYATASIGKWHLGGEGFWPTNQGFDTNVGGNHKGSNAFFGPFDLPGLEGRTKDSYLTDELQNAARDWVGKQTAAKTPFFLYSPNYSVHTPIQAPEDRILAAPGKTKLQQTYRAMLEITDQHIGKLRDQLRQAGQYENTIWLITSDNGGLRFEGRNPVPHTDNSPLRAGKGHLYEGGIRVPLILAGPGVKGGQTHHSLAASVDLMPTVLDLIGQSPENGIDGVSLNRPVRRKSLFWHYPHYSNQGGAPGGAMREGDWKLIEFYEDKRLELFNLRQDPGEQANLAEREKTRALRMRGELDAWRKSCGAIMPQQNPAYNAATEDQGLAGAEKPTPPR